MESTVHSKPHHTKKENTRSVTFRLPERMLEDLETEASRKGVSLNVLVKQILDKYLTWDRYAEKIGMSPVPRSLLKLVGEDLTGEHIHKIINSLHTVIKNEVLFMKGKYDLKRCIEALEDYMKASGMSSDHRIEGAMHHFIIQHDLGINWSLFTEHLLRRIFHDFLPDKGLKVQTTESTVIATIELGLDFDEHNKN